jgi:hypothetical protein
MTMDASLRAPLGKRRARLVVAATVAGVAIGLGIPGGTAPGDAADRFVAGGPAVERAPIRPDRAAPVLAAASASRTQLGLPEPVSVDVEHVTDRLGGTTYDEVTERDGSGRTLHLQRFDERGRLVGAVSFGWQAAGGRRLPDNAAARARATALATGLGLDVAGQPDVRAEPDDTGWTIAWPRMADGIPVPGDGIRIDLWPDGRVHAVVRTERPLAVRPARVIDEAAARARAAITLGDLFGSRSGQVAIAAAALGWIAPNDAFEPTAPDAPDATLRLAWVVEARTRGDLSDGLRAVKLFLDAGSGALLGGDVLR